MNRLNFFLGILAVLLSLGFVQIEKDENRKWTLRKNRDGIKVYTRPPLSGGLKDAKAECLVSDCSMEKTMELAQDYKRYIDWMYRLTKADLVKKVSDTDFYLYVVIDTPWPFQDRDAVVQIRAKTIEDDYVALDILLAPELYESSDETVQISKLVGYWQIEKRGEDVFVSYEAVAAPGGWIPDWIANLAATDLPFESLRMMREELQ